ncbi:MAG: pyruvate, phosphate dikinase, partial [Deltaproteobacteria bacterium]|nr:pyruvate, phosphate dikinase [Deltaproteobacteria bacterium]
MPFAFGTKAETLERLKPHISHAHILDLYYFTIDRWLAERDTIITAIKERFPDQKLAVRSSAQGEDSAVFSMAGAFTSCLDVASNSDETLTAEIETVVGSYAGNPQDQVLIQPMLCEVAVSGVIMTHDVEHGAPYYIINFDDETGKTDSITGGSGIHKTVLIYRNADPDLIKSSRVRKFVQMAKELERICGYLPLDIEFSMTANGQLYLFQVRRISLYRNWHPVTERRVARHLAFVEEFLEERFSPRTGIFGDRTLLAVMPDWNPAEIIGTSPRPFAASLYRELITRRVWHEARTAMGYRRMPPEELMVLIAGHPYIDVRNSFNSFLPQKVEPTFGDRLINAWLNRLEEHPELHDKVEFEIAHTCYDFNFDQNFKTRYPELISAEHYQGYRHQIQALTHRCVTIDKNGSLAEYTKVARHLEHLQQQRKKAAEKKVNGIGALIDAAHLIDECKKFGTFPFSVIARHAFIAEALLRSAVSRNAIDDKRVRAFKRSIRNITGDLINDYSAACTGKLPKVSFMEKYGHLRPGTYDVTSLRYDERDDLFSDSILSREVRHPVEFHLNAAESKNLDQLLQENGFDHIQVSDFLEYCRSAIAGREYTKFIFTRNLSDALEAMVRWSETVGLSRDDLSYLTWPEVENVLTHCVGDYKDRYFLEIVESNKRYMTEAQPVKLSYMIRNPRDIYVTTLHRSEPNFIGIQ